MVLEGRLTYRDDGMTVSTRAMVAQIHVLNVHTDNIANFGVPGYQRKDPVVTSFVEFLGANAIDKVTSTEIGRLRKTDNPLDVALNTRGYLQRMGKNGQVEMTRDGRMKLDKDGYVYSLDDKKMLSAAGIPVKLPVIPTNLKQHIKIDTSGDITVFNAATNEWVNAGRVGVVSADGSIAEDVDMKQGFVEDSNVYLAKEFTNIIPLRRQFEANRQLFILQSDSLSRMIQELGRTQ